MISGRSDEENFHVDMDHEETKENTHINDTITSH